LVSIVLVRTNSIIYDPRVNKIANSLKKKFSLICLGWNREGLTEKQLAEKCLTRVELFNLKSPYGKIRTIAYLPIFWIWVFFKLVYHRPEAVHACDVDTIFPCYFYKILFRKKLVFDVFDRIGMSWSRLLNSKFLSLVDSIEEKFIFKSDIFITVSEKVVNSFKKPLNYFLIMNCPIDHQVEKKIQTRF